MDAILVFRNRYRANLFAPFLAEGVMPVVYGDMLGARRVDAIFIVDGAVEASGGSEISLRNNVNWIDCDLRTCLKPNGHMYP